MAKWLQSDEPINLSPTHRAIVAGLVRTAIRKADRGRAALERKYGESYDPSRSDSRIVLLEEIYRAIGGDPENITVAEPVHDAPKN